MTNEEAIAILIGLLPPPMRCDGKSGQHLIVSLALARAIEALKSEPKHGRWIDNGDGLYYCSNCEQLQIGETLEIMTGDFRFCPYCGSQNKRGELTE